ncbi:hypothetical protein Avbf_16509 [Armadillidium vulgare]|nr:hypothetical protein Avbf_16509 [Armadillidium vulgare]
MMLDDGVDTEDSPAVAISLAAMPKLEICKKIMQFYAYLIPKLFPTEDSNTYFISRQTDGIQQKRTYGKLIERHRNIREKFRKLGLYSKQNFKSETKKSVKSITLNEDENTISSTLFDWPILQHANGYILINIDFKTMFCTSAKFYLKWNMNKEGIKRLMMERIKDKTWKNVFKSVYPENSGEYGFFGFNIPVYFIGEDAALLYLLPLLLKPKKIALPLKEDTFWKPSKRDMQEAFVIHVQNPEDVLVTISRKE